jgi:hypothetical protein
MAEGPVAALSVHPGGDFGSTDGKRLVLCEVLRQCLPGPLEPEICAPDRISIELLLNACTLSQINRIDRRSY